LYFISYPYNLWHSSSQVEKSTHAQMKTTDFNSSWVNVTAVDLTVPFLRRTKKKCIIFPLKKKNNNNNNKTKKKNTRTVSHHQRVYDGVAGAFFNWNQLSLIKANKNSPVRSLWDVCISTPTHYTVTWFFSFPFFIFKYFSVNVVYLRIHNGYTCILYNIYVYIRLIPYIIIFGLYRTDIWRHQI